MGEKKLICTGKFYLKSGLIIEEKIEFDEDNEEQIVIDYVEEITNFVKTGLKNNDNFQLTFGFTIFRGSDISAVKFELR